MKRNRLTLLVCALVLLVAGNSLIYSKGLFNADKVYESLELFTDVLSIVKKNYINDVSSHDLIENSLKGMLQSLDPHSQFLDAEMYQEMQIDTEGKFGGLGIEITIRGKFITIIAPIPGSPAEKAGILPDDIIVKINDSSTEGITIADAVKRLRGELGSSVKLTLWRPKTNEFKDYQLKRETILIKSVPPTHALPDHIGYIRITQFQENTGKDFTAAMDNLVKQGVTAVVLDMRNNPGGLLEEAVAVAESFLKSGQMVVYTHGRNADQNMEYPARKPGADRYKMPLVVLVNRGSASGSEIVAGALQDWRRGVILGENSFGKASVQSVIPVRDGCAVRLTIAKYFTPKGRSIDGNGIEPDVMSQFESPEDAEQDESNSEEPQNDKAAATPGKQATPPTQPPAQPPQTPQPPQPPSTQQGKTPADETAKPAAPAADEEDKPEDDAQIQEAVNLLKAIRIYGAPPQAAPAAAAPAPARTAAAKP